MARAVSSGDPIRPGRPRAPWIHGFGIHFFTLVLAVLLLWLLGFVVDDIESIEGPDRAVIEAQYVDQALKARVERLDERIDEVRRREQRLGDEARIVSDSSRNLQSTIDQLASLQRLSIEKEVALPTAQQATLASTLERYLESQARYQALNARLRERAAERRALEDARQDARAQIALEREPARREYEAQWQAYRWKLAGLQLAVFLPLLVVAAYLVVRKRGSIYFPLFTALAAAAVIRAALVMHRYFPPMLFRYLLAAAVIAAVGWLLVHLIRMAAFPKGKSLARQYREAYERFLCPICEFPIRVGPRRFLYWTRRTVNRTLQSGGDGDVEEPYTCPACGTRLLEPCSDCGRVRHTLLGHCAHCGAASPALEARGR